jgi:cytochrome c556
MNKFGQVGVIALGVLALGTAVAGAQSMDAIKARQAAMKSFGGDSKAINDYVKGAGDQASAVKAANDMADTATKLEGLWPAGTSSTDMPGMTQAKAAIWANHDAFVAKFAAMSDGAKKLAATIGSGTTDDVKTASGDFAKANCGACHMMYREAPAGGGGPGGPGGPPGGGPGGAGGPPKP